MLPMHNLNALTVSALELVTVYGVQDAGKLAVLCTRVVTDSDALTFLSLSSFLDE